MTLGKRILTGMGWVGSSTYINAILSFAGNIFLARLLLPDDFGLYALAASFLSLIFMIAGFGSQESIIQCHDETIQHLIPTAFWMTIVLGIGLTLAGNVLGLLLLPRYGETLSLLVVLLSWLGLAGMISNTYAAVLQRDLIYKPFALIQTIATFISFGSAILAAYRDWGVWSLILREAIQMLFVLAGYAWASGYRLQRKFDARAARWIWNFGWKIMGNRIGEVLFERMDKLIVGSFLGITILGQYSMAYRLALLGHQFSYGAIQSFSFAVFSNIQQESEKLRQAFEKLYYWLFRFALILGLLVWFCGARLVVFIYGSQWQLAGNIFQNMAVFLALLPLEISLRSFLIGAGYITPTLKARVWQLLFLLPVILAAVYWGGILWVLWGITASLCLIWLLEMRSLAQVIILRLGYIMQKPTIAGFITFTCVESIIKMGYLTYSGFWGILYYGGIVGAIFMISLYLMEHRSLWAEWVLIRTRLVSS